MLNDRLKLLRENKGLTKRQVADFLKIDESTYGKYELGKRHPDLEMLSLLADFYNCTTDYLIGRTDKPNLELIENNLPQELIDAGIHAIKVFKGLKVEELTQNDIKYLVEFAEKVQKNRP